MKELKKTAAVILAGACLLTPWMGLSAESKKAAKAKPYPLTTCLVSDEKLGEMGEPYVFEHEGQEVKMCCKACLKDFKKNPAKYLKKISDARAKEKKAAQ